MLDQDIKKAGTEPFRKSDPDFEKRLFEAFDATEVASLNRYAVIGHAELQPDDAIFVSARNGVYVQNGQPGSPDYRRRFIHYDGRIETVTSVDEGAPPESFGGGKENG